MTRVRGPQITPEVEALVVELYRNHPKWTAPTIRNEASALFREKNKTLPTSWPSLSSVRVILTEYKKRMRQIPSFPEDEPWSLSLLDKYPLPYNSLSKVAEIWKTRTREGKWLTIREAKWVSRLSPFAQEQLEDLAILYARLEQIYQLAGRTFNSAKLDQAYLAGMKVTFPDIGEAILYMRVMFSPEGSVERIKESWKNIQKVKHGK